MNTFYNTFKKIFWFLIDYFIITTVLCLISGSEFFYYKGINPYITSFIWFVVMKIVYNILAYIVKNISSKFK